MLGAIIGDIIGSVYELDNTKTTDFPLWSPNSTFTDDTVMTVAVAKALLEGEGTEAPVIQQHIIKEMQYFGGKYPYVGYGSNFCQWLAAKDPAPYNSWGNGSAMRVSSVGWLYPTLERTLAVAKITAEVSHNHPFGIAGAQSVAAAIFLLRTGKAREQVRDYITKTFGYSFQYTIEEIRPAYTFDISCQGSVPQAMTAFWEAEDFEDCIRKAVSIGGDSDTIAAIAGSMAEAYFEVPQSMAAKAIEYLDTELLTVYKKFLRRINKNE